MTHKAVPLKWAARFLRFWHICVLTNAVRSCKLYKYDFLPRKRRAVYGKEAAMSGGKHLLGRPKGYHIFGTAKVGEKGQIVIPKEARTLFRVEPGDTLLILGDEKTGIIVTKPDVIRDAATQVFENLKKNEARENEDQ